MTTPLDESPGEALLRKSLPDPNTKRWVVRRKAAVVAVVRRGELTIGEACQIYQLSDDEFLSWDCAFEFYGLPGLRTTRIQHYRGRSRARRRGRVPLRLAETAD